MFWAVSSLVMRRGCTNMKLKYLLLVLTLTSKRGDISDATSIQWFGFL